MFCSTRLRPASVAQFHSAEEAWFWAMAVLLARRDGCDTGWRPVGKRRPCDPEDVFSCLDRLYRARNLQLRHVRVLRMWGERQTAPDGQGMPQGGDWQLWQQAMAELEWSLRRRRIVG